MPFNPSEFVCRYAAPGIGCGYPEMIVLGVLYTLSGFFCLFCFAWHIRSNIRNPRSSQVIATFFGIFWFSMFLWLVYDGVITIFPFDYNELTFRIFYLGLDLIFYLIPLSIFVLLVLELSFAWRNPGNKVILFFRVVFIVFLVVYIITGASLMMIETDNDQDPSYNLYLWIASTDLLISMFTLIPALQLIKLVSEPVVQPEDVNCVRLSKVGAFLFFIVFIARFAFNIVRYVTNDPIASWAEQKSDALMRAYKFFQGFIFNLGAAFLAISGTIILQRYDFKFSDQSTYVRAINVPT